jgi:hypothetical protein
MTPWIDKLTMYLSDPLNSEDPEPYSKRYSAGGTELEYHNLEQNHSKRKKTQHNQHTAHTINPPTPITPTTATPARHTTNTMKIDSGMNGTDQQTSSTNINKYNLRSKKTQHQNTSPRKRKQTTQKDYKTNTQTIAQRDPTPKPNKRSSAEQAPPRINMAFPAPCTMPHKPPTLPATPHQLTLDRFFTKKHTNTATQQPANTIRINTPTPPKKETTNTSYRHPAIHAVTFNTRGMHNTILDLHRILNSKHKPTIINLTETKHSHIKSIWRDTLKDYKLTHTHPQN